MCENYLLALDVGTRKVTGLLLEKKGQSFSVLAAETREHLTRAMLDGQIHDIPRVAEVVSEVHNKLEEKGRCKISGAAVAAAGRSLCTQLGQAKMSISSSRRLQQEDVMRLEYAAVHQAQQQLLQGAAGKERLSEQYNCVGYSVIRYEVDGLLIGNLIGQRGTEAACQVIATFLPRVVVDSLRGVLEMAGLKLQSLTLEPIAALRMVVPEGMRRLNLALVDIGAGTSDIAITRDGTVVAYDMVPVAGDEITEALMEQYLLDFMTAEEVKRSLTNSETLTFVNILGEQVTEPAATLLGTVRQAGSMLADKISSAILAKNGVAPQAVFCVGGGSLTPGLTELLTEKLAMSSGRVAIKGNETLQLLPGKERNYRGPELVTPLGIASTAVIGDALHFYRVEVNGLPVDVMDLGRSRVSDALLAAGISSKDLIGAPGKGLSLEVNGEIVVLPGEMGDVASIYVNGMMASLDHSISAGDSISVKEARQGAPARADVAKLLLRISPFTVSVNGEEKVLTPPALRDNEQLTPETELCDRDKLRILKTMPLAWVMSQLGLDGHMAGGHISVTVSGEKRQIPFGPKVIRVNSKPAVPDSPVSQGDALEIGNDGTYPTVGSLTEERPKQIEVSVNEQLLHLPLQEVLFTLNGRDVPAEMPLTDGDCVEISVVEHEITMAKILNLTGFQTTPPTGRNKLVLRLNGRDVQFTTTVKHGDRLETGWSA